MINRPTPKELFFALLGLIGIVACLVMTALIFHAETSAPSVFFYTEPTPNPDCVNVMARLIAIDPVRGDLTARLQFTPQGSLNQGDDTPSRDLQLDLNSSTGKVVSLFKKDERMNPMDVTVSLYNGSVMEYPFDSHEADLLIVFSAPVKNSAGEIETYEDISARVEYTGALAGYSLQAQDWDEKEAGTVDILISIERSASVKFFAIFIMVLQWLLAFIAILAVWVWVVRGNKIEVTMFGWLGALLFSLIPLRNAMPGIPAFGTLSDLLAFFWVEAIVTLCMVVSICTWAFYRAKQN